METSVVDPHSFSPDPDPGKNLKAVPDPDAGPVSMNLANSGEQNTSIRDLSVIILK